jgi:hypothetical protein
MLSGCALTDVNVKPPSAGLKTPIPGGNQRQIIVTAPFTDSREIKSCCGVQKGGYGNETAVAVCQGEPAQWLAVSLVGCSARAVVVAPDQVSKLNDSKWTVTSEPAARPR